MDTPKFPHHRDCEALTGITLDHLPRDGALGRVRRFAKRAYLWHADDAADRVYFLHKGRVAIMTAKPHERPVALRTIEPDQPFGELCVCSTRTGMRETTACALLACEVFEIKTSRFLGLPASEARGTRGDDVHLMPAADRRRASNRGDGASRGGAKARPPAASSGHIARTQGPRRPQGHGHGVGESQRTLARER